MSFDRRQDVILARNFGSTISALFVTRVEPLSSVRENEWWAFPSAPTESQANDAPGVISVMVLVSRCVPNNLATVLKVLPTCVGPSLVLVTWSSCPDHSP